MLLGVPTLHEEPVFPDPKKADPRGLLAVGGDLSVERLLAAYTRGIFPWYDAWSPILWWSPDPRMVLFPESFHLSRRMARILRSGAFHISADTAFTEVIHACAVIKRSDPENGTWIIPEMEEAYTALFTAGYGHSIEVWQDGELAGGLYGVSTGRCFFGESMFSRRDNASKAALYALSRLCLGWGFAVIDCQFRTPHLNSLGAEEIPRRKYLDILSKNTAPESDRRGSWSSAMREVAVLVEQQHEFRV
jgi:leucyl/phenylalanyl-tRNA---protein transferase